MAPELENWVASQLAEEATILKERREGREERDFAAGTVGSPSGDAAWRPSPVVRTAASYQRQRALICFPTGVGFFLASNTSRRKCG